MIDADRAGDYSRAVLCGGNLVGAWSTRALLGVDCISGLAEVFSLFSTRRSTNVPLSNDINSRLQARVTSHFDIYLMEGIVAPVIASRLSIKPLPPVKLRMDIPTSLGGCVESLGVTDALISLACNHRRRKQGPNFRQRRMGCFQRDIELSPRHHRALESNPSHLQRSS